MLIMCVETTVYNISFAKRRIRILFTVTIYLLLYLIKNFCNENIHNTPPPEQRTAREWIDGWQEWKKKKSAIESSEIYINTILYVWCLFFVRRCVFFHLVLRICFYSNHCCTQVIFFLIFSLLLSTKRLEEFLQFSFLIVSLFGGILLHLLMWFVFFFFLLRLLNCSSFCHIIAIFSSICNGFGVLQ